jgi:methionine synthase II (cobalamin-independent)
MGESKERIDYIIAEVKATQAMAGLYVTEDEEKLLREYLRGNLSKEELFEIIKQQVDDIINKNK